MKLEEKRIAIAKACGWDEITFTGLSHQGIRPQSTKRYCNWNRPAPSPSVDDKREWHWIPDYINDLNAMHEAEKVLNGLNYHEYMRQVEKSVDPLGQCHESQAVFRFLRSTAAQRAEALLKTLGLWTT